MKTKIYVVVTGRCGGDYAGASMTADRVWFQHMSSSLGWLEWDTTGGFAARKAELDAAYPDGWESVLIEPRDEIPDEIKHHLLERP